MKTKVKFQKKIYKNIPKNINITHYGSFEK